MSTRERIAAALVIAACFAAALLIGGAPRWGTAVASALALASTLPLLRSRRVVELRLPLLMFFAVALGLTLLQLVPLPAGLVELVSAHKHQLLADNARALGEPTPAWMTITYDPAATLLELARLSGYAAAAYTCLRLGSTSGRARLHLVSAVAALGGLLALLAFAHRGLGLDAVYGVYEPRSLRGAPLGPLVNPNHLAALLAVAAPIAAGLALHHRGLVRWLWAGVGLACLGATLLSASRGGALGLAIAVLIAAVLWTASRGSVAGERKPKLTRANVVAGSVLGLSVLVLVGAVTAGGLLQDVGSTRAGEVSQDGGKVDVWRASGDLVVRHKLVGVGRGAYAGPFARWQPDPDKTYTHAENEYLQAIVDWGIPGAAGLGALLAMALLSASRRWRAGPAEAAVIAALVGLSAHSLFDFSLSLPGVALPVTVLLASLSRSDLQRKPVIAARRRYAAVAGAAAGAIVVALSLTNMGRQAFAETDALIADQGAGRASAAESLGVWRRHPSEYMAAGISAQAMLLERHPRSFAVLNRALFLNPQSHSLHWLAARALLTAGNRDQALLEYAAALRNATRRRPILEDLFARFPSADDAARGIPLDHPLADTMFTAIENLNRADVAHAFAQRLTRAYPREAAFHVRYGTYALEQGDSENALAAANVARKLLNDRGAQILVARVTAARGDTAAASAMLRRELADGGAFRGAVARRDGLEALIEVELAGARLEDARAALHELLKLTPGGKPRARLHLRLADVEDRLGNRHQALAERKLAKKHAGE